MAAFTGRDYFLSLDGQQVDTDYRMFDPGFEAVTVDGTASGDSLEREKFLRERVAPKGRFIVDGDATGVLIRAKLKVAQTYELIFGPEGNGTGKPKWGMNVIVKKGAPPAGDHTKEQEIEVEWANTDGAFTYDGRTQTF